MYGYPEQKSKYLWEHFVTVFPQLQSQVNNNLILCQHVTISNLVMLSFNLQNV